MRVDIDRLIDIQIAWVKFNMLKPFRVLCYEQIPYKLPTSLIDPKIKGYFILAGQDSYLYLFDISTQSYCFLDNLKESNQFVKQNKYNSLQKIKGSNVAVTNNYFFFNGEWFQEIIKISES